MTTSSLSPTVQKALPGLKGFDCDTPLNNQLAAEFKNAGYSFCIRYLSLTDYQSPNDLSASEIDAILSAGLALSAVQHVLMQGWTPSWQLGTENGNNAASNAASIGLPKGMNLWCDVEGISESTSAQTVIDYCIAWYDAVQNAGYVPGIYVGAGCLLSGQQLYELPFGHYWKSGSIVPDIPVRGYQMIQSLENQSVLGIGIDIDSTQNDNLGDTVLWLIGSDPVSNPAAE